MEKRKWLLPAVAVFVVVLLGAAVVFGYAVYDYMFPVAAAIDCPDMESITSITLMGNDDTSVTVEIADAEEILKMIRTAQPTRNWSIQDYPVGEDYYTVEIDTAEREYRYFVYFENAQAHIESPYEGVYRTDRQILELIAQRLGD